MNEHTPAPPGLPEVRDEAVDTPRWVPALGLALLAVFVLVLAFMAATNELGTADAAPATTADSEPSEVPAEPEAPPVDDHAGHDHAGHGH